MPSSTQKSEMCIRYAAWVLWPIFTFILSVLAFSMCHFARLKMPVYEDTEGNGRWDRNWTGLTDWRAFIRSWNVVLLGWWGGNGDHRLARSVEGVALSLDQSDDDVLRAGASKIIRVFVFIFSVICYFRIKVISLLLLFGPGSYNSSLSCLVILYRKQACWTHIWHDLSGSESSVFA